MQVSGLTSGYNLSNLPEGVHLAKKILVKKRWGSPVVGRGGGPIHRGHWKDWFTQVGSG